MKASKKPYLSIIIPAFDADVALGKLLASLRRSTYTNFEVIVGDDASQEPLEEKILRSFLPRKSVKVLRLYRNRGPASARNLGAKKAHGRVLIFFDSDVTVYPDTLTRIAEKFEKDHDLTALTGVWDKHQRTRAFFPQFKALRDWSYWINERDRDGYYYLFSTRVAAIKRDVFERLGGFNESFRQMEDVELTYRIARRYAIIFAPDVRVHHEFEGFLSVARKYFWRSFYWTKLYKERRKFDPVATTMWESVAAATGVGTVGVLGAGTIVFFFIPHELVKLISLGLFAAFLVLHFFLLRKFLWFVYKEKGIVFAAKSLFVGLALYCVIFLGAVYFQLRKNL